jgi:hypothetical protein
MSEYKNTPAGRSTRSIIASCTNLALAMCNVEGIKSHIYKPHKEIRKALKTCLFHLLNDMAGWSKGMMGMHFRVNPESITVDNSMGMLVIEFETAHQGSGDLQAVVELNNGVVSIKFGNKLFECLDSKWHPNKYD